MVKMDFTNSDISNEVEQSCSTNSTKPSKHRIKRALNYLETNGCTRRNLDEAASTRKHQISEIVDYFVNSSEQAEANVGQECESTSFNNINKWMDLLVETQLPSYCQYEAAVTLNAIKLNETQPSPSALGGVDMQ